MGGDLPPHGCGLFSVRTQTHGLDDTDFSQMNTDFLSQRCGIPCPVDEIDLAGMVLETPTSGLVAVDGLLELYAPDA